MSLHIARGASLGILGPNGSGKTTLVGLIAALLEPLAGRVTLDGVDVGTLPRRALARRIAVVPQETHVLFDFTVLEIVLMGRYPHLGPFELEGPTDLAMAREALAATGMAAFESRRYTTLSGGEKQRVIIASALAQAADILILDEPTASLNLGYQIEIARLLERLNREHHVTVVLSTHDLNLAAAVSGDLVLLARGEVLAEGPIDKTLTAANIRALYQVDADVQYHAGAGHLTVVPLGRSS